MRADVVPGGTFPDYELTDHTKARRSLSGLQGNDPMILLLARGGFCPKDHQQRLELVANYPKIAVAYTQIVTVSTDNLIETNEFRSSLGAQWTFLSDAGRHVQRDLDIQEYTDPHHNPMVPHTLVLKPGPRRGVEEHLLVPILVARQAMGRVRVGGRRSGSTSLPRASSTRSCPRACSARISRHDVSSSGPRCRSGESSGRPISARSPSASWSTKSSRTLPTTRTAASSSSATQGDLSIGAGRRRAEI